MKHIIENQQGGGALVLSVERLEHIEFGNKALEGHLAKGGAEFAVCSVTAAIVDLAGRTELLTDGTTLPVYLGGILPFAFPAPLPEARAILFAGVRFLMGQQLG